MSTLHALLLFIRRLFNIELRFVRSLYPTLLTGLEAAGTCYLVAFKIFYSRNCQLQIQPLDDSRSAIISAADSNIGGRLEPHFAHDFSRQVGLKEDQSLRAYDQLQARRCLTCDEAILARARIQLHEWSPICRRLRIQKKLEEKQTSVLKSMLGLAAYGAPHRGRSRSLGGVLVGKSARPRGTLWIAAFSLQTFIGP